MLLVMAGAGLDGQELGEGGGSTSYLNLICTGTTSSAMRHQGI